ncbi:MAG: AraC family transcriptional regulator ligand-binding domain-containing protein [Pseudomonadota bacterium]
MTPSLQSSAAYVLLFAGSGLASPEAVFAGTETDFEHLRRQEYVDLPTMARMLRNLDAATDVPGWAALAGSRLGASSHGPLGFAALSAPTLGAAMDVLAEFHAVRTNTITVTVVNGPEDFRLVLGDRTGYEQCGAWIIQSAMRVAQSLVEAMMGHPVASHIRIRFAFPAPPDAAALDEIFGVACEFGAEETSFGMPVSWRNMPSPLADDLNFRANLAKCRDLMQAHGADLDPVTRVRQRLAAHFERALAGEAELAVPRLEAVAARMHRTPRTLIRQLRAGGVSYRQLLEEQRRRAAEELLQQARFTVADVAERLGYSDPANFGRAFRRWTGSTPAAWRRSGGGGAA